MIQADACDYRNDRLRDIRSIEPAAQPRLEHCNIHPCLLEVHHRTSRHHLKPRQAAHTTPPRLAVHRINGWYDLRKGAHQFSRRDRTSANADAFFQCMDVGRKIAADAVARMVEDRSDHGNR